jgi:hypothetical protein
MVPDGGVATVGPGTLGLTAAAGADDDGEGDSGIGTSGLVGAGARGAVTTGGPGTAALPPDPQAAHSKTRTAMAGPIRPHRARPDSRFPAKGLLDPW